MFNRSDMARRIMHDQGLDPATRSAASMALAAQGEWMLAHDPELLEPAAWRVLFDRLRFDGADVAHLVSRPLPEEEVAHVIASVRASTALASLMRHNVLAPEAAEKVSSYAAIRKAKGSSFELAGQENVPTDVRLEIIGRMDGRALLSHLAMSRCSPLDDDAVFERLTAMVRLDDGFRRFSGRDTRRRNLLVKTLMFRRPELALRLADHVVASDTSGRDAFADVLTLAVAGFPKPFQELHDRVPGMLRRIPDPHGRRYATLALLSSPAVDPAFVDELMAVFAVERELSGAGPGDLAVASSRRSARSSRPVDAAVESDPDVIEWVLGRSLPYDVSHSTRGRAVRPLELLLLLDNPNLSDVQRRKAEAALFDADLDAADRFFRDAMRSKVRYHGRPPAGWYDLAGPSLEVAEILGASQERWTMFLKLAPAWHGALPDLARSVSRV